MDSVYAQINKGSVERDNAHSHLIYLASVISWRFVICSCSVCVDDLCVGVFYLLSRSIVSKFSCHIHSTTEEMVRDIFTNKGVKLEEYDMFANIETSSRGGRPIPVVPRNHSPVPVKLESVVVDTEKRQSQLHRKEGMSLSPRGTLSKATSEADRPSSPSPPRRNKEVRENMQRRSDSTKPSICEKPEEAVAAALKYFEEKRVESGRKRNFPISDYHETLKNSYPDFVENARADHGIVGHVPGVEVGLTVRYRDELRLLGLHRDIQKGIDSKNVRSEDGWHNERAALSVVLSGEYKDGWDHGDVVIYVGEGGRDEKLKQQVKNQTEKSLGNVALKNNCFHKRPVRVIRNRMDPNSPSRRLYSYDGLYQVEDWEYIKGLDGFKVFLFKLVREPNQNALVWPDREPKPFVGQAARREAIARGKKVVEESAPEEAVPEDESEGKVSSNGSEDIADATTLKESEKDTVGKSDEDQDDFSIGDVSEEGGDCIVHEEIDQAIVQEPKLSGERFEEGEESSMLKGEVRPDIEKVIATHP